LTVPLKTGLQRAMIEMLGNLMNYNIYYYTAQRYYFQKDNPQKAAAIVFYDEPNLDLLT